MSKDELVLTERRGRVLTVTLNRPKANAINVAMSEALTDAFESFANDDSLSAAVLTGGDGRFFSGGWDMNEAASGVKDNEDHGHGGFAGLHVLMECNKPVIGALNGITVGGGWEMSLACDLVIASPDTRFWFPEVQRGFIADAGGVQRLARVLPKRIATEILLTGRWFENEEAERWGMVNRVVEKDQLMATALEMAGQISKGAPLSVQATKEVLRETEMMTDREALVGLNDLNLPVHQKMLASSDFLEGPTAFTEGREPVWTGR